MADRIFDFKTGPHGDLVAKHLNGARVLIYSHDTFGLGHVRRARAIANALVKDRPGTSVIIVSGSPVIGNFEFGSGVDYVRIPGVTKLPDGDYRSHNLNLSLDEAVGLRQAIILKTAETFQPDMFIVDKEPTGFHGEVLPALELLRSRDCRLVLGIRDVLDEGRLLVPEWERKGAKEALERYYDEIWVYGLQGIHEPLAALKLPAAVRKRIAYTGYLRREMPLPSTSRHPKMTKQPFILVTTGGGGDGDELVDWTIAAYETDPTLEPPALIVFGPFINRERRAGYMERIARHPKLDAITFDNKIELLMKKATAIVAMGGYNTFCEILSFDKPALIVPRTRPRLEQHIRAEQAERLGLVRMLSNKDAPRTPERMVAALKALAAQPCPSDVVIPGLLSGLDTIRERFKLILSQPSRFMAPAQEAAE